MRVNRRLLCELLFRAAAATLRAFALDPRHLGAEPAITMVLHTWGQTLTEHFHVHCVVSGGGLSLDASAWISLPKGKNKRRRPFLFHVEALAAVFRGKYIAALKRARNKGKLHFAGQSAALADPVHWEELLDSLAQRDWVVYCKPPFGGPAQVLKYLSRYTHRIAISNRRILSVAGGIVRFEYRDYADGYKRKVLPVAATEFLRRFLLHVVPRGFMRIRHYGITANSQRGRKLQRCRELFGIAPAATPDADPATQSAEADTATTPADSSTKLCPNCGTPLRITEIIPASRGDLLAPAAAPLDTS